MFVFNRPLSAVLAALMTSATVVLIDLLSRVGASL
jgi:hypothetical protein